MATDYFTSPRAKQRDQGFPVHGGPDKTFEPWLMPRPTGPAALPNVNRLPYQPTPHGATVPGAWQLPFLRQPGGPPSQTQSPFQTLGTPRNEELADRIRELMGGQTNQQKSADNALKKYTGALNLGGVKGYGKQETDYLSGIYSGGMKDELTAMRDQQAAAMRQAANLAAQGTVRDLKAAGFRSRGAGSSRLDRMAADRSYGIETALANQLAQQQRTDYDYLNRAQMSGLGRRQEIMDRLAARELLPYQAGRQFEGDELARLGQLGQMDRANQVYHLAETPDYSHAREYQEMLEAQGMQPYPLPGGGYANYGTGQTDAFARFPQQPSMGYGVNPLNGLYGYQYSAPLYNNYPRILQRV